MKIKQFWRYLIPSGVGLVIGLVIQYTGFNNPVFFLRTDLVTSIFLLGVGVSILLGVRKLILNEFEQIENEVRQQAASDRLRFINLLDHELKNPLTAIMAGLANLDPRAPQPEQGNTLTSVATQVQRLNRLVTDLRKLSDLETRTIELSRVNLTELLTDAFDLIKERIEEARTLNLVLPQAPWPLPEISADRDLLFLAVHNILDNAVKFTEKGDTIELRASEDGRQVLIEVADTGPGIPEDEQTLIWGELFRGKGARGIPGSGLGLSLVQAIVRRHNGNLSVRSQVNKGTIISLSLPVGDVTDL
jgi:two-component system OmpR family sensor kinase